MPTPAQAKRTTVRYNGGSVTASLAAIEKLLGQQTLGWSQPMTDTDVEKRRPYGSIRVSRSSAGSAVKITFLDGSVWTYRVTGMQKTFIANMLGEGAGATVTSVKFPRKTRYGAIAQNPNP